MLEVWSWETESGKPELGKLKLKNGKSQAGRLQLGKTGNENCLEKKFRK